MIVDMPDGSTVEFPDDTPHDVVNNALQQHWASKANQPATQDPLANMQSMQQTAQAQRQMSAPDVQPDAQPAQPVALPPQYTLDQMATQAPQTPPAPTAWGTALDSASKALPQLGMARYAVTHPQEALQTADDTVRDAANGATFGQADRFAGGMNGLVNTIFGSHLMTTPEQQAYTAQQDALHPGLSKAANAGGGLLSFMASDGLLGAGARGLAATESAPAVVRGAAELAGDSGLAGQTIRNTAIGSGFGAGNAAENGQAILPGAIYGAGAGAIGTPIAAGLGKLAGGIAGLFGRPASTLMTRDELNDAAQQAYQGVDQQGVLATPQGTARLYGDTGNRLSGISWTPENEPGAAAAVRNIARVAGQPVPQWVPGAAAADATAAGTTLPAVSGTAVSPEIAAARDAFNGYPANPAAAMGYEGPYATFGHLNAIRRMAGNGFRPGNGSNNYAISQVRNSIDDLLANPNPGDFIGGDSQEAFNALQQANALHSQVKKLDTVQDLVNAADRRASTTGTGSNGQNTMRQNMRGLAENEAATRGFTPDETDALNQVVDGSTMQNFLRRIGKAAPTGIVSGGLGAELGAHLAGGPGAIGLPLVGSMAKWASDRMAQQSVQNLENIILAGGSRAAAQAAIAPQNAAQQLISRVPGDALVPLIMGGAYGQRSPQPVGAR